MSTKKLTAISISVGTRKIQVFLPLEYVNGRAILPKSELNRLLDSLNVRLGDTYTIG